MTGYDLGVVLLVVGGSFSVFTQFREIWRKWQAAPQPPATPTPPAKGRPEFPKAFQPGEYHPTPEQVQLWFLRYLATVPEEEQTRVADALLRGSLLAVEQHFWPKWTGDYGAARRNSFSLIRTSAAILLPVWGPGCTYPAGMTAFLVRLNQIENDLLALNREIEEGGVIALPSIPVPDRDNLGSPEISTLLS